MSVFILDLSIYRSSCLVGTFIFRYSPLCISIFVAHHPFWLSIIQILLLVFTLFL